MLCFKNIIIRFLYKIFTSDEVVTSGNLTDVNKSEICEKLALAESNLLDGADEYLQMMSAATFIMKVLNRG